MWIILETDRTDVKVNGTPLTVMLRKDVLAIAEWKTENYCLI